MIDFDKWISDIEITLKKDTADLSGSYSFDDLLCKYENLYNKMKEIEGKF